ncbi:MAG: substrate-binding domain-containing protein [Comamonas sp.]
MAFLFARRSLLLTGASLLLGACASTVDEKSTELVEPEDTSDLPVHVLMVQSFTSVHRALEPRLLVPTKVHTEAGGGSVPAVAAALGRHLKKGSLVDVVAAPAAVMEQLRAQGLVQQASMVDVVRSPLALLVQAGRPEPAIATVAQLKRQLESATSIAYPSTDGSEFIEQQLLPQLGIKDAVLAKALKAFSLQVAALVARGDAALGLQALSELTGAPGITVAGTLPAPFDYASTYTVGIATHTRSQAGAQALLRFYQEEVVAHDWQGTGWEAIVPPEEPEPEWQLGK